ncbi:MAG: ADP-glyceromanno-heptose 6-epimerase [Verrucomicrobiota bacterium]
MNKILVTGGAGFIGSNLVLELQEKYPEAAITVIDDFRSGDFKNLREFQGDVVAADMAELDWKKQFGEPEWDAVFHIASITDTTCHDQKLQVRDNVESFRNLLEFVKPKKTPVIYATSAATYGIAARKNTEKDALNPANVYAFSKMILENLARRYSKENPKWKIIGLRYFNVYGPREAHKGVPASMIYHLAQQMSAGKRPRLFKYGEQKRDFVYVKDIVNYTIATLKSKTVSGVFNAGTGTPRAFNDIVAILNKLLKTNLEIEYFDNPYPFYQSYTEASMTRAHAALGIKPKFTLESGIRDYFQSGFLVGK